MGSALRHAAGPPRTRSQSTRQLETDASGIVGLAQELESVRTYLAIQQVRFGEHLAVNYRIEDGLG